MVHSGAGQGKRRSDRLAGGGKDQGPSPAGQTGFSPWLAKFSRQGVLLYTATAAAAAFIEKMSVFWPGLCGIPFSVHCEKA